MRERKIILSRKGFDSKNGGKPSPILPDGTMLSIPIPDKYECLAYEELFYEEKSYLRIIRDLGYKGDLIKCHLDPDLRYDSTKRDYSWKACFGQSGTAASHLKSQGVSVGDIFLFFGWFRKTEYNSHGKLQYAKDAPDVHAIFGYLQVGEVANNSHERKKYHWHPHANEELYKNDLNFIFVSADRLLDSELSGAGVLKFNDDLCLTKKDLSRSKWKLPECLSNVQITYHNSNNNKKDYFQSAMIGQEFVFDSSDEIEEWISNIVINK